MTAEAGAARLRPAGWLAERLGDPGLVVLEVAMEDDPAAYRAGHVPGARFVHWQELLWHATDREFPGAEEMARRLGALGIGPETTVVLCGDPIQFATYAFWVLQMHGHRRLVLLDGGRTRWLAGGFPLETDEPEVSPVPYPPAVEDHAARIGRKDVLAALERGDRLLLDLRSPEEYRGERLSPPEAEFDHGATRCGRIPTARHLFYRRLLAEDERLLPPAELRAAFAAVGATPEASIVAYCRLSHRATLGWFVLTELLGFPDVRVYDGSWTEWGSIVGVPIER